MSPEENSPCRDCEDLLIKKCSGELLTAEENRLLDIHLPHCRNCADRARELSETWDRCETLSVPEIPAELYQKTFRTIVDDLRRSKSFLGWIQKVPNSGFGLLLISSAIGLLATGISYVLVQSVPELRVHYLHVTSLYALCWLLFAGYLFYIFKSGWHKSVPIDLLFVLSILMSLLTVLIFFLFSRTEWLAWLTIPAPEGAFRNHFFGSAKSFALGWTCSACLGSFLGALLINLDRRASSAKKIVIACLFTAGLLLPAIYLHGLSYGHDVDIAAFGVLGSFVGALLGTFSGFHTRHFFLQSA